MIYLDFWIIGYLTSYLKIKKYGNVFIPAPLNQQITDGSSVSRSYGKMLIFLHTTMTT